MLERGAESRLESHSLVVVDNWKSDAGAVHRESGIWIGGVRKRGVRKGGIGKGGIRKGCIRRREKDIISLVVHVRHAPWASRGEARNSENEDHDMIIHCSDGISCRSKMRSAN